MRFKKGQIYYALKGHYVIYSLHIRKGKYSVAIEQVPYYQLKDMERKQEVMTWPPRYYICYYDNNINTTIIQFHCPPTSGGTMIIRAEKREVMEL